MRSASASARAGVRLASTTSDTPASSSASITPCTAPPAPSTSVRRPRMSMRWRSAMSVTRPMPSVLSPRQPPPGRRVSVLTTPLRRAASPSSRASFAATVLSGSVTFAPVPPAFANASSAAGNASDPASIAW